MSDNTNTQTEQANQLPPCDPEVFSNGVSIGFFEMPKEKAESLCEALRLATGYKIDWHYFAGRVHIKALPAEQEDSELSRVKAASIEAMCRAYQAEARAERAIKESKILTAALLKTGCLVIPHGSFFLEDVPKIIGRTLKNAKEENERLRNSKAEAIATAESADTSAEQAEAENVRLRSEVEKAYLRGTMYVLAEVCRQGLDTNVEEVVKIAHGMGNWLSYCEACECHDLKAFVKVVGKWGLSEMEHRKKAVRRAVAAGEG